MKTVIAILMLFCSISAGKTRPPILDPEDCPYPYDANVVDVADPLAWLPADVGTSLASEINVWNRKGYAIDITIQEVYVTNEGETGIREIPHSLVKNTTVPTPDINGGFNQSWSWGINATEERIYYLLFTATTPSKPNWAPDQRIICIYAEEEDVPILWVQDAPVITDVVIHNAQRLWQVAAKYGPAMTAGTTVRLAKNG